MQTAMPRRLPEIARNHPVKEPRSISSSRRTLILERLLTALVKLKEVFNQETFFIPDVLGKLRGLRRVHNARYLILGFTECRRKLPVLRFFNVGLVILVEQITHVQRCRLGAAIAPGQKIGCGEGGVYFVGAKWSLSSAAISFPWVLRVANPTRHPIFSFGSVLFFWPISARA